MFNVKENRLSSAFSFGLPVMALQLHSILTVYLQLFYNSDNP